MKINSFRMFWIQAAVLAMTAAAGQLGAAQEVVIGVVHWEQFAYAEMMKSSYEMAVEEINAAGGVKGGPVRLAYANDLGERRWGEAAVIDLVKKQGAAMLLGGYSSSNTLYTAMAADSLDTPFLVCTAADDRITQRKLENIYRLNPPSAAYTGALEAFFKEKVKPRSMAIVYENSPYGTGAARQMLWFCRENDIELLNIVPYIRGRASDAYFGRILGSLKQRPPDVIYMVSYLKDGAQLVAKIRDMQLRSLLCGGAGGFTHYKFPEMAKTAGDRLVTAALWAPQTGFRGAMDYYNRYQEKFSAAPDYHGAEAYTALLVAAEALRQAAELTPAGIRAALDQLDLETPFGRVRFGQYGAFERQNKAETLVLQVVENRFECIWPPGVASGSFDPPEGWRAD
jgi:branched-chain amino acid transport system substrate-binding protein